MTIYNLFDVFDLFTYLPVESVNTKEKKYALAGIPKEEIKISKINNKVKIKIRNKTIDYFYIPADGKVKAKHQDGLLKIHIENEKEKEKTEELIEIE